MTTCKNHQPIKSTIMASFIGWNSKSQIRRIQFVRSISARCTIQIRLFWLKWPSEIFWAPGQHATKGYVTRISNSYSLPGIGMFPLELIKEHRNNLTRHEKEIFLSKAAIISFVTILIISTFIYRITELHILNYYSNNLSVR